MNRFVQWLRGFKGSSAVDVEEARRLENTGKYLESVGAYEACKQATEALRVAELWADLSQSPSQKSLALSHAVRLAKLADAGRVAELRLRYVLSRWQWHTERSLVMTQGDLVSVAGELDELGEPEVAADAYLAASQRSKAIDVLQRAGKIDAVEKLLGKENQNLKVANLRKALEAKIWEQDAVGQRLRACETARELVTLIDDAESQRLLKKLEGKLLTKGGLVLVFGGERCVWWVQHEWTVGRAGTDLVIGSAALSRTHVRFFRDDKGVVTMRDCESRNGTFVASARVADTLPITANVDVRLGGEVLLSLGLDNAGHLRCVVGDTVHIVTLGEGVLGPWRLQRTPEGIVRLAVPAGAACPVLANGFMAPEGIDLVVGDVVQSTRSGPTVFSVLESVV